MNEKELLMLRLEDLQESADNKEVKTLTKALNRYLKSLDKKEMGFQSESTKSK